jgi:hypothetical protein
MTDRSHPTDPTGPSDPDPMGAAQVALNEIRRERLRTAAERIRLTAPAVSDAARTGADPQSGERWDRGQFLAHVAEMLPYWAEQAELVAAGGNGIPFGRVKSDPQRIAAIEHDRRDDPEALLDRIDQGVDQVIALLDRFSPAELAQTGTHPTRGEMSVTRLVDEFVIDHLEEHAEQIEQAG